MAPPCELLFQDVTAPSCELFHHFIHICMSKVSVLFILLPTYILISFLVFIVTDLSEIIYELSLLFIIILCSGVELNPGLVYSAVLYFIIMHENYMEIHVT